MDYLFPEEKIRRNLNSYRALGLLRSNAHGIVRMKFSRFSGILGLASYTDGKRIGEIHFTLGSGEGLLLALQEDRILVLASNVPGIEVTKDFLSETPCLVKFVGKDAVGELTIG
jgi:hypothetical protein